MTLNPRKTRISRLPEESFDFLGYTFGRCYAVGTGRPYIGTRVSRKAVAKLCAAIRDATRPRSLSLPEAELVGMLNRALTGWANYFQLGAVSKAYRAVDAHTRDRLRRWLRRKHKARHQGKTRFPDEYLYEKLGLTRLEQRTRDLPWAKA